MSISRVSLAGSSQPGPGAPWAASSASQSGSGSAGERPATRARRGLIGNLIPRASFLTTGHTCTSATSCNTRMIAHGVKLGSHVSQPKSSTQTDKRTRPTDKSREAPMHSSSLAPPPARSAQKPDGRKSIGDSRSGNTVKWLSFRLPYPRKNGLHPAP